jgi:glycosyltransferase involved in cell wall biosynthesis
LKILFLTPQLPAFPPRQGTALRNYHLMEGLATQHQVALLTFLEPDQPNDPDAWGPVATFCQQIGTVPTLPRSTAQRVREQALTSKPDMALRLWSDTYSRKLESWLGQERFDVVHVEGVEMAPYIPVLRGVQRRPLIVLDNHNAEYVLQERAFRTDLRTPGRWHAAAYSLVQWRRLARFEASACRQADRVVAVSEADRAALLRLAPDITVHVLPNCIDTAAYQTKRGAVAPAFDLLFTGKMDFRPNVDAAIWFWQEVWPRIIHLRPDLRWGIVGKSPHRRLGFLQSDPRITVVGEVPDMIPYLQAARVGIIPLRMGGGTRFKLLEAMASGLPIVSTTVGAEGVPVRSEQDLLLADNPADFAAAVVRLLDNSALADRLVAAARELVQSRFDWRTVVPGLERVYAAEA